MASEASIVRDDISKLSRLSVSEPSSSLRTGRPPIPRFGHCAGLQSISYVVGRKGTRSDIAHDHEILFEGYNNFTVDGGDVRDANDPKNAGFLESIKNCGLPEEFAEDGLHKIRVVIGCGGRKDDNASEVVSKEYIDEFYSLMSIRI